MHRLRLDQEVGWRAFFVWALAGVLWTVPWFTFGVGVVTLPFAGLLTWALGRHAPQLRDIWGLVFGVGGLVALVGLGNLDGHPLWVAVGLGISILALLAYRLSRGLHPAPATILLLGLGVALVVTMAVYLWQPSAPQTGIEMAGSVSEIRSQGVVYLADAGIYVVATDDGFVALDDDARHLGERVLYCPLDDTFTSPVSGGRFDHQGRYAAGPAQGDMGRFPVTIEDDQVAVDVSQGPELPPRSAGTPPNGPTPCSNGSENPAGFFEVGTS
jgi:hypothetical protein